VQKEINAAGQSDLLIPGFIQINKDQNKKGIGAEPCQQEAQLHPEFSGRDIDHET
jgi:hypothetical protein